MTKIEALELELAARKMVDGTGLGWVEVLRTKDTHRPACNKLTGFNWDNTELALGIIEGKPVWKRDSYYYKGEKFLAVVPLEKWFFLECTWNPPTPKTVMVELLIADAEHLSVPRGLWSLRINEACRKALENMK